MIYFYVKCKYSFCSLSELHCLLIDYCRKCEIVLQVEYCNVTNDSNPYCKYSKQLCVLHATQTFTCSLVEYSIVSSVSYASNVLKVMLVFNCKKSLYCIVLYC